LGSVKNIEERAAHTIPKIVPTAAKLKVDLCT